MQQNTGEYMLDIFMTKLQSKYHKALKWDGNAQDILKSPLCVTSDIAFNLSNRNLHHLARISIPFHHCYYPKGFKMFPTFVREQTGKSLGELYNPAFKGDFSEITELREKFAKKYPIKLSPYGKFLKRRKKSIWKDFPNMHEVLVQEIKALDAIVRKHILDIRKGKTFPEGLNFYDLIVRRDRIACLQEFYYDCVRDFSEGEIDPSVCCGDLLGNDGAVSYGTLWVIDSGLWSVFNHYKVDPLPLATSKSAWFRYTSRLKPIGHWWVVDWNPDFYHSSEEWELDEDEKYLIIT